MTRVGIGAYRSFSDQGGVTSDQIGTGIAEAGRHRSFSDHRWRTTTGSSECL